VFLGNKRGDILGYAASWWSKEDHDKHLAGEANLLSQVPRRGAGVPAAADKRRATVPAALPWPPAPERCFWPTADPRSHTSLNRAVAAARAADRSQPIGRSLSQRRTEVHRDIAGVYRGRNASLEAAFAEHGGAARGPAPGLWGRHYLFWHRGRPLTLIMEVFSPRLCKCLGPAAAVEDGAPTADVAE